MRNSIVRFSTRASSSSRAPRINARWSWIWSSRARTLLAISSKPRTRSPTSPRVSSGRGFNGGDARRLSAPMLQHRLPRAVGDAPAHVRPFLGNGRKQLERPKLFVISGIDLRGGQTGEDALLFAQLAQSKVG